MDKRIIIGLSVLVASLGGFLAFQKWGKKKPAEEAASDPAADKPAEAVTENKALIKTVKEVLKPKPRTPGFVAPPKPTTTFNPKVGAKKTTGFAIGDKLYANDASGVNTYSKPQPVRSVLVKHYKKDEYIGTYLGQEGKGSMIKVIVQTSKTGVANYYAQILPGVDKSNNNVYFIPAGQVYTK